jgi:two-component system NtrC family sensor kinase
VLGVLDVALSLDQVDATLAGIRLRIFLVTSILILCLALFVLSFTKRFVEVPIRRLTNAARAVSAMRLNEPVVVSSRDEIGELAVSFESMRLKLKAALDELARSAHTLEARIEERTDQLRVAHQKLRQSDRLASLGKLSASMAHEINNPVSGILNLGMLMQRILKQEGSCRDREEELRRYLTMVVSETERVGRIVKDLLAFSRRSSPRRDTLDLNAIVRSTVELVSHKINQMGVEVDLELADGVPVVCGDRSQMQEVLINLLMNAAEASQSEVGGHVAVRTRGDGESVTLEVEDNGEGIPPENLQKIFDPFFTTKEEGKGVGLGLSVVYGIIEAHQGDIDVSSGVGAGTTFTVRLPACRPGEAQCQDGGTT